jgi:hypothetical protein
LRLGDFQNIRILKYLALKIIFKRLEEKQLNTHFKKHAKERERKKTQA